jgi:hypothetical protein
MEVHENRVVEVEGEMAYGRSRHKASDHKQGKQTYANNPTYLGVGRRSEHK